MLGCPIGVSSTEAAADSEQTEQAGAEVFTAWATAYATALRTAGRDEEEAQMLGRFIVAAYEGAVTMARATRSTHPCRDATTVITDRLPRADV